MKQFFVSLVLGMLAMLFFIIWLGDLSAGDILFILTTPTTRG